MLLTVLDGTTRRITNWETLSAQERESSWRLISARNKRRIEELKRQRAEEIADEASTVANPHQGAMDDDAENGSVDPILSIEDDPSS